MITITPFSIYLFTYRRKRNATMFTMVCMVFSCFNHAMAEDEPTHIRCLPSSVMNQDMLDTKELRAQYMQAPKCWPEPTLDVGVAKRELGLLPAPIFPADNPFSQLKLRLGDKLFHDPQLSRSGHIACASCHDRDLGWADGRQVSFGHHRSKGKRNAPSIENSAFYRSLFWDGRAASLEEQALMPITDSVEMNFTLDELEERLSNDPQYVQLFKLTFGSEEVTRERIAQAIATFERTILSRRSRFDIFLMASEIEEESQKQRLSAAFSDESVRGLHLFRTKARCMNCHNGPEMSDSQFHNIGLTYYKRFYQDLGLYNQTRNYDDVGKFRTPGLRGVMNTKPWMHNGLFVNMEGLLNFYNMGGVASQKTREDPLAPQTSIHLKPLKLTQSEINDLLAFLESISGHPARGSHMRYVPGP